jgi:hypothetical protein
MRSGNSETFDIAVAPARRPHDSKLDLVVPFTTPVLTRAALAEAGRQALGLSADVRLVKIQVVPYPLKLDETPVYLSFLRRQLDQMLAGTAVHAEIYFARDFEPAFRDTLDNDSVVVLASKRRPWPTRIERLARTLRGEGYPVILISESRS